MKRKRGTREFLTVPEAADELNVSVRKIWKDIEEEKLKSHKFGRARRISRDDFDDYIRRSRN